MQKIYFLIQIAQITTLLMIDYTAGNIFSSGSAVPETEQKVVISDCVKSHIELLSKREREKYGNSKEDDNIVPLYRYLRLNHGDHFYTIQDTKQIIPGYKYEGIAGMVHKLPRTGTVALHRYFNGGLGDHFYTTSWSEAGGGKSGWAYEGIECYVYDKPMDGTLPLYRYWNGKDHFYTVNWSELRANSPGWTLESIQAYIFPPK